MKRLKEDLKNKTFHGTYLLYGEENYLKKMYRDRLKQAVLGDNGEMNYSCFEGKDIDLNELKDTMITLPFFSDYRLVVIESSGLFKRSNELSELLKSLPETTIVVFVEDEVDKRNKLYKFVNKNGLAVEMKQMTDRELKAWLVLQLKNSGHGMKESTADFFLEHTDGSMYGVSNELEKLIAYTDGRTEITREDISQICSTQVTSHIFQMLDAVALGKQNEVLRLYHELLILRENAMSILYLLSRHFHILLQVKDIQNTLPKNEIASRIGIPPFAVGKYQAQCRSFTKKTIQVMLEECIDTEYQFKRGNINDRLGIEILLLSFMNKKTGQRA